MYRKGNNAMWVWGLLFVTAFFSLSAQADDRFYIAPSLSYLMVDSDREVDNALGMRFSLGLPLTETLSFEYSMFGATLKRGDRELQQGGMTIDALYYFHHAEAKPQSFYVVFGGGTLRNQEDLNRATNTMFDLGLGLLYEFSAKIKFRVDFRYRLENATSGLDATSKDDFVLNVGLVVPIGVKN